jgi:hypothetical protein
MRFPFFNVCLDSEIFNHLSSLLFSSLTTTGALWVRILQKLPSSWETEVRRRHIVATQKVLRKNAKIKFKRRCKLCFISAFRASNMLSLSVHA